MWIHKKTLQLVNSGAYTFPVAETTAARIGVRNDSLADNRRSAVFLRPYTSSHLLWSGLGGGALAHAGIQRRRYANPAMCPATPIGVGSRVTQPVSGGRTMLRHIPARPEQPQFSNFLTDKVSGALRSAALAPSLASALDIAGAARVDIATIARSERRSPTWAMSSPHDTAATALQALDRVASILESIERLASDNDGAIADLASLARGLLAHQIGRAELVFTSTVCQNMNAEVRHG